MTAKASQSVTKKKRPRTRSATLPVLCTAPPSESEGWICLANGALVSVRRADTTDFSPLSGSALRLSQAIAAMQRAILSEQPEQLQSAIMSAGKWMESPGSTLSYEWRGVDVQQLIATARSDRAYLTNVALENARVVLWSRGNGVRPPVAALFCPDDATAHFALELTTHKTRICANKMCGLAFVPTRSGQRYHSGSCGSAARMRKKRDRDSCV